MEIRTLLLGVVAVGLGFVFWGNSMAAKAESISIPKASAPEGLTIDSYFERGHIDNNSANVIGTSRGDHQAVLLTDGANQLGTIWTSDVAKMNMRENQTASMWMYFGNGQRPGDGMAFVIQNGGLEASAIDHTDEANPIAARGETLGVWGADANNQYRTTQALAATGIQNSWALEFDTFDNRLPNGRSAPSNDAGWNNYFSQQGSSATQFDSDMRSGYPHIASNYPGEPGTYKIINRNLSWSEGGFLGWGSKHKTASYRYATMAHQGAIVDGFALLRNDGGAWKHLTLKWQAPKANSTVGKMTYAFNDKNPVTGANLTAGVSTRSVPVDLTMLHLGPDKRVRWGFTGSTGDNFENNLIVFEQVPGLVDVDATARLVDNSQANMVIQSPSNKVYTGDRLTLKYRLTYRGGRDAWQDIQSKLNLPKDIAYDSAAVTYDDGRLAETIAVNSDDISGQTVSQKLARALSQNKAGGETASATITLTGMATSQTATPKKPDVVVPKTSRFEGTNAITQATTSGFQVVSGTAGKRVMTMALTGDHVVAGSQNQVGRQALTTAADVRITGKVVYQDINHAAITGKTLTIQPRYNGENLQTTIVSDDDRDGIYDFSYTIPATALIGSSSHSNVLELFATDISDHLSAVNNLRYTVTVKNGTRSLSVSSFATFNGDNPQRMTGAAMRLRPDNNWSVKVFDSMGKGDVWTLQASASPVTSRLRGGLLAGDLKYVDETGTENSLTQGTVDIETHQTVADDDILDIADSWKERPDRGLFLDVSGDAQQGQYMSRIKWTFAQVPVTV
ncbi:lectin-like domain-containing protein [Levilactobacillus sp. N40-8-2]|uniref:lectin-like domain-containing protein n=1 Tax=Levilactobacillus muriae TaxID=3238987 RepID=UPI0038B37464